MINQVPRLAAGLAITGALALAGCGSSSGGSSSTGSSSTGSSGSGGLSKAELASRADAACSAYTKAASAIPQPKDFATNPVAAAAFLDKLKPLTATEEQAMLALTPDSATKALWDRFIAAGRHTTALFDAADAKAHARDRTGLADLEQLVAYKARVLNPIARQLGATACGK